MKGKYCLIAVIGSLLFSQVNAQNSVGIGIENSNDNAVLELVSPNNNQGFLVPRLTSVERLAMATNLAVPENGLLVFDSNEGKFYYWHSGQWNMVTSGLQLSAGDGIEIIGNTVTNTGDDDADPLNEIQDLELVGTTLSITNNTNAADIDLSPFAGIDTDDQELQFNGGQISLSDDPLGTTIDLSNYDDNVIDDFDGAFSSLTGVPVDIADGDNQGLSIVGNDLSIGGSATIIDLTPYIDNTDNQDLQLNTNTLSLSGDASTVDLSSYLDNSDDQALTYTSGTQTLTLEDGGTPISFSALLDNTDNQDLQLNTNTLSLTNDASSVDLSSYLDNTDNQDLQLNTNTLSLSGDASTVDLSSYLDNSDDQALTYTSGTQTLTLEDGGTPISFSALLDNTGLATKNWTNS